MKPGFIEALQGFCNISYNQSRKASLQAQKVIVNGWQHMVKPAIVTEILWC